MLFIIGIGLCLIGIVFVLISILVNKSIENKKKNCFECVDAKIVNIKKEFDRINPDSMRHLRYRNCYQYMYNNETFNVESKFLTNHQRYKIGQTIKLYINPNNLEEFYNKEDNYNTLIYIFSIIGTVMCIIGLLLIFMYLY